MPRMNPMFLLTSMMAFAFSLEDEDDEDYKPRVVTKSVERKIAKFPDISAFGPKSIGALKILEDWINDDLGEWLTAHGKPEFLDEDSGAPIEQRDDDDFVKREINDEESADGTKRKGADGAGAGGQKSDAPDGPDSSDSSPQTPLGKQTVSYYTKLGKRRAKLMNQKRRNFVASQATFYLEIKDAVKHNSDVLAEVVNVPKCDDRGSKAVLAIKKHIMQGKDPGSVKKDSDQYFTDAAASFNLKYPQGTVEPIDVKPDMVHDHLSRALSELEIHVNDYRKKFCNFPAKHWTKYIPEQNLIGIVRDLLPETPEWRQVRIMIMQGQPAGDDFDKAIGLVRFMITEFTSRAAKLAIHRTASNQRHSNRKVTSSPSVPASTKSEAQKKAENDKFGLDDKATCYACNGKGHKSNWWGCPKFEETKKKKQQTQKAKKTQDQPSNRNGGRGGGGRGGRGKGGRGRGGKSGGGRGNGSEEKDYSNVRCHQCLDWGHIAKNCPGRPDDTAYANSHVQANNGYSYAHVPTPEPTTRELVPYLPPVQPVQSPAQMPHPPQYERQSRVRSHNQQQMRPAGAHLRQSPMQHLQYNVRQAQNNHAPPPGSFYRNMQRQDPNES